MAIGIPNNLRPKVPVQSEPPLAAGRGLSALAGGLPGLASVDAMPSTLAAGLSAVVQLNLSQAGAGGDALPGGSSWVPQSMTAPAALLGLGQILDPSLLNGSFINATRDFAASLLNSASAPPARAMPLATPVTDQTGTAGTTDADEPGKDPASDKLSMLVDLLTQLADGMSERGKSQLIQLKHTLHGVISALEIGSTNASAAPPAIRVPTAGGGSASAASVAQSGFTFEIEISHSVSVNATIAQLNDNGFQAVSVQASSASVTRIRITVGGQQQRSDPVVLDLNRDGDIDLAALANGDGQAFDINADGAADKTSFVAGGDAFLALDRNGNGTIDDGKELFGDQNGAANGMEELRKYDANADGRITMADPIFGRLRALYDVNGDGKIGLDEHRSLAELGIAGLSLNCGTAKEERADGNAISAESQIEFQDGTTAKMADADLTFE